MIQFMHNFFIFVLLVTILIIALSISPSEPPNVNIFCFSALGSILGLDHSGLRQQADGTSSRRDFKPKLKLYKHLKTLFYHL